MSLLLPVPPSINDYWRVGHGHLYKSTEAKQYQHSAKLLAYAAGIRDPAKGPVFLRVKWRGERMEVDVVPMDESRRSSQQGDIDNRLKCLCDALQGSLYVNDR